jgi:hypothetical protein
MENSENNISKNNDPLKLETHWRSLKISLIGFILLIFMCFIKIFIYNIDGKFFFIPILIGWYGIMHGLVTNWSRLNGNRPPSPTGLSDTTAPRRDCPKKELTRKATLSGAAATQPGTAALPDNRA